MAEEIGFENGRNSNFQGLVTLTLTLDAAIRHTVVHDSSTSTYILNFIQIEETFCGRMDGRTFFPLILLGRLLEVDLRSCHRLGTLFFCPRLIRGCQILDVLLTSKQGVDLYAGRLICRSTYTRAYTVHLNSTSF